MAIERWFYHKFHHGLTLADVERYTHLLVGIQFFIVLAAAITAPIYWLATKPWLRAALLRGDYSDELDEQGRPGSQRYILLLSDGRQSPLYGGDWQAINEALEIRTSGENPLSILALGFATAYLPTLKAIAGPSAKPNACARRVTRV